MSGIAGFLTHNQFFNENDLDLMAAPLAKRGNQSCHHFFHEGIGMVHQRLSFVDKSTRAQQPMQSHNDRFVMVMDGQAYNYNEIARGFLQENFKTDSDVEIVLENFVEKNIRSIYQINGMFAVALYDQIEESLFLFRDRVGIKPLYYFWDEENFAFASELDALFQLPQIKRRLNKKAVAQFLHLGYIPAPNTLYQNIYKLEAGSWLRLHKGQIITKKYWNVAEKIYDAQLRNRLPYLNIESNALQHFEKILHESLEHRLPANNSYGVWLDHRPESSLIATLLAQEKGSQFPCLAISYPKQKATDQLMGSKIAQHLKLPYEEVSVAFDDIRTFVKELPLKFQEPIADFNQFTYALLAQKSKDLAEIMFTAHGADALFYGNNAYRWAQKLDGGLLKTFRKPYAALLKINKATNARRASALLNYPHKDDMLSHIYSQHRLLFSKKELPLLLAQHTPVAPYRLIEDTTLTRFEQQALFDISYDLADNSLFLLDQALMSQTIEARTPLLDFRVIEFAINLNYQLKYRGKQPKYLVKQLLAKRVPEKLWAKSKPVSAPWLLQWMQEDLGDYLNEKVVNEFGLVRFDVVKNLQELFKKGHLYLYNRLWALTVLHIFLADAQSKGLEIE
ncbi:hypothetical protein BKI52_06035 [marine bacterium AO1-C]|nr:hypothetical protein BKI52_06035 [marine bacterium AO1-C]